MKIPRAPNWTLIPEVAARIRWSRRGSCGNSGCTDPECCCSLCAKPIGLPEDHEHFKTCAGCELCSEQVPFILWRGEGKHTEQAQFCNACFSELTGAQVGMRVHVA